MKDKNPPANKKGANGMNFWCRLCPQIMPNMHENTNAMANPNVPSHNPATANNFMSPMPIGVFVLSREKCSKIIPTIAAMAYPKTAPATDSAVLHIHGKKCVTINPISINGNKYASGMILRRKSATDIRHAQNAAPNNNAPKKM